MCAVRTLTEGTPDAWNPGEPSSSVTGVVLRTGDVPSTLPWSPVDSDPFLDLWTGGMDRVRIVAYGAMLRNAIQKAAALVGDTVTVTFTHWGVINSGKHQGLKFKAFTVSVVRGHH